MQWGGSGRSESAGSLLRASSAETTWTAASAMPRVRQPARRLRRAATPIAWAVARSISVYGQAIGEDEANNRPSHFLVSAGVDLAAADRRRGRSLLRRAREHDGARHLRRTPARLGLSPSHLHRRLYPARRSARPSALGRRHPLTSVGAYVDARQRGPGPHAALGQRLPDRAALAGRRQDLRRERRDRLAGQVGRTRRPLL